MIYQNYEVVCQRLMIIGVQGNKIHAQNAKCIMGLVSPLLLLVFEKESIFNVLSLYFRQN